MTAEELFENFDFNNRSYYYHITEQGIGDVICEEGLLMANSNLYDAMIPLTPAMVRNFSLLIDHEFSEKSRSNTELVIIATDKGRQRYLIKNNNRGNLSWNGEGNAEYCVLPENILGYLDLSSPDFQFIDNPNCYDAEELENMGFTR